MCYNVKVKTPLTELVEQYRAAAGPAVEFTPHEKVSGFAHPLLPVISVGRPNQIQLFKWGLIPAWTKPEKAADMAKATLNAREDTIFDLPSFRDSIESMRCILLVDGFYEWRHEGKEKIPYYITLADGKPFALGCIYAIWENKPTFSVVTTAANPIMEYIHNIKKRMPLMLSREEERRWIDPKLTKTEIKELMQPLDENLIKTEVIEK